MITIRTAGLSELKELIPLFDDYRIFYGQGSDRTGAEKFLSERLQQYDSVIFMAFEGDSDVNRSVSREHAHIQYDRTTGEYRLFNDRWYPREQPGECGTWIVRDGMSQEVHRTSRGAKLEPGDEIRFGRAVVLFEIE